MYIKNSGLIAKPRISKYKIGPCITEKLVLQNSLLFIY